MFINGKTCWKEKKYSNQILVISKEFLYGISISSDDIVTANNFGDNNAGLLTYFSIHEYN